MSKLVSSKSKYLVSIWYQPLSKSKFFTIFALRFKKFFYMAVSFIVRTTKSKGDAPISIRVRSSILGINILQKTNLQIPIEKWNLSRDSTAFKNYRKSDEGKAVFDKLEEIEKAIEEKVKSRVALDSKMVQEIIDGIVYREIRELEAKKKAEKEAARQAKLRAEAEAKRVTLTKFIEMYLHDIECGARQTDKGTNFSYNTVKGVKTALKQWELFQAERKKPYDFGDIDLKVYYEYTAWLKEKEYSVNSIGKCISNLKVVMNVARSEGYHNNNITSEKKFKSTRVEVDAIYLTKEELKKLYEVDLSGLPNQMELARDIFMVGCWTAQRVSDYNNIKKGDFEVYSRKFVVEEEDPQNPGRKIDVVKTEDVTYLNVRQQKTGTRVAIPVSSQLKTIMEKYNYQIPHLADQTINQYLKKIGEMAGIDDDVEIVTTKGGTPKRETFKKYELIMTHTARRTGATLMYLAGMDIYDIMKITGHTSPQVLKKYIRADELQVVDKIKGKYTYFD